MWLLWPRQIGTQAIEGDSAADAGAAYRNRKATSNLNYSKRQRYAGYDVDGVKFGYVTEESAADVAIYGDNDEDDNVNDTYDGIVNDNDNKRKVVRFNDYIDRYGETITIGTIGATATTTTTLVASGCGGFGADCTNCRNIKILLRLSLRYFYDINCEFMKSVI